MAGPVAFVLPGGASLGAVQVGMLQALTDAGIVPDLLVGTSVGALNAAMFAASPDPEGVDALAAAWAAARRAQIFPLNPLHLVQAVARQRGHLVDNQGLRRWIGAHLPFDRLDDAPVPLHVVATDVQRRAPVVLSSGDAASALLASCAIPGVFPPVPRDGLLLSDGGVTANEPVPQAIALGARTIFRLSTRGTAEGASNPRARLVELLDRRVGRPVRVRIERSFELAGRGDGLAESTGAPVTYVMHELPAPPTADVNPFSFRQTARLIERSTELTVAWLAEHLQGPLATGQLPPPELATGA